MGRSLVPVGPEIADIAARKVLRSHEGAILEVQTPSAPSPVLKTTTAGLPAMASYPSHIAIVTDAGPCLAFCDGAHWRKADGTVIV